MNFLDLKKEQIVTATIDSNRFYSVNLANSEFFICCNSVEEGLILLYHGSSLDSLESFFKYFNFDKSKKIAVKLVVKDENTLENIIAILDKVDNSRDVIDIISYDSIKEQNEFYINCNEKVRLDSIDKL
jgi:hypothetical protein